MILRILLLMLLFSGFTFAQQTVGVFSNQPSAFNGYTLFNSFGSPTTYLIDNCGTVVHEWNSNNGGPRAAVYLLEDGNLLRTYNPDDVDSSFTFGGAGGGIELLDPSSNAIWEFEINTDSTLSHHDIEVLPNGNILILAIEVIPAQEASDNGSIVTADRYSEMILEFNPSTQQIVWEWHAWDHLIQEIDSNLANYGIISDNPGRIDINYAFKADGSDPDWLHFNSIDYNADLDQIIVSCPTFNEFWIIDHSSTTQEAASSAGGFSGKGGNILYRWGNPEAYGRGDSTDRVFEYQHDAHWIPSGNPDEGKIMVFNNGDVRGYSSIDILIPSLDTNNFNNYFLANDSTPYGPYDLYWSYSDSANFYSPRVSGSQQLQNGNILICSGFQGKMFEIEHLSDSVVWEYIVPINSQTGPITQGEPAVANRLFRSHRFSPSYSGFDNLMLLPTSVIELNPLPSNCELYISGCTDSYACNYDPLANLNDSTCIYHMFSQQSFSICNGDSILVGSNVYYTSGTYTDTLTAINGCDSTITTNLTVYSDVESIIFQNGNDITLTTTGGTNPYSYEWNTSDITQSITLLENGEYWAITTDVNSCMSDTSFFTVDWISTSISEININNLSVYPNPSNDVFNVTFFTTTKQDINITILNSLGEVIYNDFLNEFYGFYNKNINMSQYPNTFYILRINTENGTINEKILLQNNNH